MVLYGENSKKLISILTAASCLLAGSLVGGLHSSLPNLQVTAEATEILTYTDPSSGVQLTYAYLEDGTIAITDCEEYAVSVQIPAEIDGVGVTEIGKAAFLGCTALATIIILDGVTKIDSQAFYACESLISVTIPESVAEIGSYAFYCAGLTTIHIPDTITEFGGQAFTETPWLLEKLKENPFVVVNGVLIDHLQCEGDYDIVVSDGVTIIGKDAFYHNTICTTITIPDSVTKIETYAFSGCTSLSTITIPDSVREIGSGAFSGCTALANITLSDRVTTMGHLTFSGCKSLTAITIPDGVTTIGNWTFAECESLTAVTIPNNVTNIGVYAFENCTALSAITIENSLCEISDSDTTISDTATIYGYTSSTAEAYADKYNRNFVPLDVKILQKGDVNGDGVISVEDAVLTLTIYAQKSAGLTVDCSEAQLAAADIDGDGNISVEDAVAILTYYAKQSAGLNPTWD